ncbi:NADH peroxidase [Lactobacillus selangorensis]|uniref:NADH peroxidase n=1 Tax=Lactobacillus selangorensis TaxID=81857 RepID=A0A0R2FWN3_9LACO|nr:FAD-dependent oxidoreductase [Lactobacillus selangorensis]KRN28990.1 NADH peroxidase [Lactobacillus selangorensis]KRN32600.1 NADH peroxidase [Lactobacillus selangorensis]
MRILVVGSSHAGYEAVKTARQQYPDATVAMFEEGDKVSFLSCGIQSYLEGITDNVNKLHYASKDSLSKKGVDVYVQTQVDGLDVKNKTIHVVDLKHQQDRNESYDKLILAPGALASTLPIPGHDLKNVGVLRGRDWAIKNKEKMVDPKVKNVVIVGGGYIGIEVAEAYNKAGKNVTIIDVLPRIIPTYLDEEFTDILEDTMMTHGIKLRLGEDVQKFIGDEDGNVSEVVSNKGSYPADVVVQAVGVKPNTKWLDDSGLAMGKKGVINVDAYQRTSNPDVFAAGDATMVTYAPTDEPIYIALASNSRRQGVTAAKNLVKETVKMPSVSGTSALAMFEYKYATSGMKEADAAKSSLKTRSIFVRETLRPRFISETAGNADVYMKMTYEVGTGRILGAQLMSKHDITMSINVISVAISTHMTIDQLAMQDFFFQPNFDHPWNYLNILAQAAVKQNNEAE